ncbi:Polyketide cyclase / dehydrase and lipid transport [compost metagenome]
MNKALAMLGGLGIGAGLTYLTDSDRGRRRRALLRDKAIHLSHVSQNGLDVARRDLGNRTMGWVATTSSRLRGEAVDDPVLVGRVRAKLGRHCSHPHAVQAGAQRGRVVLAGPILAEEAGSLLDAIRRVPGVVAIEDRLERHERADIPRLRGGRERAVADRDQQQPYWSPATRLVAGIGGGGLLLGGLVRGGWVGMGLGLAGAGLLSRAIANRTLRDLLGWGPEGKGITLQKTLTVNAPIDQVYAFWNRPENFPRFMRHIREVRNLGEGRSHWVVSGPAGIPVEWEAETTRLVPNSLISWRSVPGSTVGNTGAIHLQANPDGSTRLHIQLSYRPPAGVLGHALATLFGTDPKHEMDDDLARMKLLIQQDAGRLREAGRPVEGLSPQEEHRQRGVWLPRS